MQLFTFFSGSVWCVQALAVAGAENSDPSWARAELDYFAELSSARLSSNPEMTCSARLGSAQRLTKIELKSGFTDKLWKKKKSSIVDFSMAHLSLKLTKTYLLKQVCIDQERLQLAGGDNLPNSELSFETPQT